MTALRPRDLPWRSAPPSPRRAVVGLQTSLSLPTRAALRGPLATAAEWAAARAAALADVDVQRLLARDPESNVPDLYAGWAVERAALRRLIGADAARPGRMTPRLAWHEGERERRAGRTPTRFSLGVPTDWYMAILRRRGPLLWSEYAMHVIFEAAGVPDGRE